MVDAVLSWPTFIVALLVFGFAPGALLRVVVLAFHHDDPRRDELRAELHAVPRIERPFWVFEQLEVALFEGLWDRIIWAATGRVIHRWRLDSGVERNRAYPDTFPIPSDADKRSLEPGATVKLLFEMKDGWGERMWVDVVAIKKRHMIGTLSNRPAGIPRLDYGDTIKFTRDHVIDIDFETSDLWKSAAARTKLPSLPPASRT
ncbi:MAG: DUF2314 domain-containing protein [Actinomycetota bacterium]|nr:DUF2314 domain-containing protein [Actinomycetota bacterium]